MKLEQLAFINQQLAGMLRSGIPLEGALRQISSTMRQGLLREELRALESDLAAGVPLPEALGRRRLPPFYKQVLQLGARSGDLPGVLTLLADHYQRLHLMWMRLKGLLFYPALVLGTALVVSALIASVLASVIQNTSEDVSFLYSGAANPAYLKLVLVQIWLPSVLLTVLCLALAAGLALPRFRHWLRWRLPAFREARLSQLASALALLLDKGASFPEALDLVRELEAGSPVRPDLDQWRQRLAAGTQKFSELAADAKTIPALFVWLVAGSGEDWAGGFRQAAQVYHDRAMHRVELMLYAVLPISVLALGLMIVAQTLPVMRTFLMMFQTLTSSGE